MTDITEYEIEERQRKQLSEALDEIERLRVGIQSYLEDDFALKYSRRNRHDYFRALLNPKDSEDD